ncbi:DUF1972 domain-containing protein [uncultured Desulfobacter sp.]|uniref:DUF1972 domain-containing protein n=1 Tax=uncultured Desulfobacter sp. TaxID=240139 RepID=UPI002AA65194|nr:DUF1972 domain-containing protein [uncultured Desulfobacter sp.]
MRYLPQRRWTIAILGTRGIPNNYGGFEQCAEIISTYMIQKGHQVTVYNPSDHFFKGEVYKNVKIQRIFSNEKNLLFFNVFIFDFLSLLHAVFNGYDIILELGYHPASLFYFLKRLSRAKIITNFAGMEWKRSKWSGSTQKLIRLCERIAVKKSDAIIADNVGIQAYIKSEYNAGSFFSAYGAELFESPDSQILQNYSVEKENYFMMMARFQKDNNFEMVLDGYALSGSEKPMLVIGNHHNEYGSYLKKRYKLNDNIKFIGGIYNYPILCSLRWYADIYFHGHSCGGTNPSLLEAMASNAFIAAHDNQFNRAVLGPHALFFDGPETVSSIIKTQHGDYRKKIISANKIKVKEEYNWDKICNEYLQIFNQVSGTEIN